MSDLFTSVSQKQAEIEKSFIGCLVIAPDYVKEECKWLDPSLFANEKLGRLWAGVLDGDEVMEVASRLDLTSEVFGYMNKTGAFQQAGQYANAIAEKNFYRQVTIGTQDLVRAIQKQDKSEIEAIVEAMGNLQDGKSSAMRRATDIGESLINRINQGDITVPFGIKSMDWATGGAEKGTCTILAGRTSMGKTALAIETAEHQVLEQGKKVGFFALEMSAEQLAARRTCHKVKNLQGFPASWQDVRSENIDENNKLALFELIRAYVDRIDGKLCIQDATNVTTQDIIRIQSREKFDVIYVDHLGLLKDQPRKGERHDMLLGRMVMALHELAKNTGCVVIVLHQLNREVGSRAGNRPTLTDLQDSGKIEQNADNVLLLHRDSYWDASLAQDIDPMEVIIAKYRDGSRSARCYVGYDLRAQKFVAMWAEDIEKLADDKMESAYEQGEFGDEPDDIPF